MTKYIEILFRYKLRFLLLFALIPFGLTALLVAMFPSSQGGASLWVDTPNYFGVSTATTSGWNQYLTPSQNTVDQFAQLVKTQAYIKELAARLDNADVWQSASERSTTLSALDQLKIVENGSHLVNLNFTCRRAPICVQVLASTIDIYRQTLAEQRGAQAKAAADFYQGQINKARAKLSADQTTLASYVAGHPNLKPGDQGLVPEYDQILRQVDQDRTDLNSVTGKLDGVQFDTAATSEVNNAAMKVIDPPVAFKTGLIASLPKKQLMLAWGACFGLGAVWLFLLGWLDRTAQDPRELEKILQVPVVAEIPVMAAGERL